MGLGLEWHRDYYLELDRKRHGGGVGSDHRVTTHTHKESIEGTNYVLTFVSSISYLPRLIYFIYTTST